LFHSMQCKTEISKNNNNYVNIDYRNVLIAGLTSACNFFFFKPIYLPTYHLRANGTAFKPDLQIGG